MLFHSNTHTSPISDAILTSPLWSDPADIKGANLLKPYARLLRPLSLFLLTCGTVGNPKAGDPGATPVSVIKIAFETWLCSYLTPVFCYPFFLAKDNESRASERNRNILTAQAYSPGYDAPINIPSRVFSPLLRATIMSAEFKHLYRETVTSLSMSAEEMSRVHPNFTGHREHPNMWNAATRLLVNDFMPKFVTLGTLRIPTILNLTIPRAATCASYPTTISFRADEIIKSFFPRGFQTQLGSFTSLTSTPFMFEEAVSHLIPKKIIQEALFDREQTMHASKVRMSRERADFAITEANLRASGAILADSPYHIDASKHAGKFAAEDTLTPKTTSLTP